jgi:serine/threonine-protein kinase
MNGNVAAAGRSSTHQPTAEAIRSQLAKIVASPMFAKSSQRARFLEFVVQETLNGHASTLKEYNIAHQVLGRKSSFDPRLDPIVRVQANHVRSRLREYYAGPGCSDEICIDLPAGAYVPTFSFNDHSDVQLIESPRYGFDASLETPSIAVLPCIDLGSHSNTAFCDGITEELITALSSLPGIRVVGRTSVFRLQSLNLDLREIGVRLGADLLLETSIRRSASRLRAVARLSEARTGYVMRTLRFDTGLEDVFSVQEKIATTIVDALGRISADGQRHPALRQKRTNIEVYDQYLLARFQLNRRSDVHLYQAIDSFERIIKLDPDYAPAHSGLAHCYLHLIVSSGVPRTHGYERALQASQRALEIDPYLAEAHTVIGAIKVFAGLNPEAGEVSFLRAIELAPSSSDAHYHYGAVALNAMGRFEDALQQLYIARRLDPFSVAVHTNLTTMLYLAGEFDKARMEAELTITLEPEYYRSHWLLACIYLQQEKYEEAAACVRTSIQLAGPNTFNSQNQAISLAIACACGKAPPLAESAAILESCKNLSDYHPLWLAVGYASSGSTEDALRELADAVDTRDPWLVRLRGEPLLAPVRLDPRFQNILTKIKLARITEPAVLDS